MNLDFNAKVEVELDSKAAPEGYELESRYLAIPVKVSYSVDLSLSKHGINGCTSIVPNQQIDIEIEVSALSDKDGNLEDLRMTLNLEDITTSIVSEFEVMTLFPTKLILKVGNIQKNGDSYSAKATGVLEF